MTLRLLLNSQGGIELRSVHKRRLASLASDSSFEMPHTAETTTGIQL
jgi:hypothetical protein